MQHVVHQLVQQETMGLEVGLFADENARNFYIELKVLLTECLESLYALVKREYAPKFHQFRFMRGLEIFNSDNIQAVTITETARALSMFPTINQDYQSAMIRYTHLLYGTMVGTLSLSILSFKIFLIRLYQRVSQTQEISSLRYFTMSYLEQDIFLKDVVRMVMKDCMTTHIQNNSNNNNGISTQHIKPSDSVSNIHSSNQLQFNEKSRSLLHREKSKHMESRSKHMKSRSKHMESRSKQSRSSKHSVNRSGNNKNAESKSYQSVFKKVEHQRHTHPINSDGNDNLDRASSIMDRNSNEHVAKQRLPDDAPSVFLSKRRPPLLKHASGMRVIDTGNPSSVKSNPISKFYYDSETSHTESS